MGQKVTSIAASQTQILVDLDHRRHLTHLPNHSFAVDQQHCHHQSDHQCISLYNFAVSCHRIRGHRVRTHLVHNLLLCKYLHRSLAVHANTDYLQAAYTTNHESYTYSEKMRR